jgi:hypothetical protein
VTARLACVAVDEGTLEGATDDRDGKEEARPQKGEMEAANAALLAERLAPSRNPGQGEDQPPEPGSAETGACADDECERDEPETRGAKVC